MSEVAPIVPSPLRMRHKGKKFIRVNAYKASAALILFNHWHPMLPKAAVLELIKKSREH